MSPVLSKTPRWILYKHTSNLDIIRETAIELRAIGVISKESKHDLMDQLRRKGLYVGRNPNEPLDAIQHRINTLLYYMFGYREGKGEAKRFVFSPLGALFLRHLHDPERLREIILTMVWGKQFPDPFFATGEDFRLYPFRLLFKLMSDVRLNGHLTSVDYAHVISRCHSIDETSYENLVERLLDLRATSVDAVARLFKADEHHHVNAFHEWQYTRKLLESLGLVVSSPGERLFPLLHGKSTKRYVDNVRTSINPQLQGFHELLQKAESCFAPPVSINDPARLKSDAVREIYSFLPAVLLSRLEDQASKNDQALANLLRSMSRLSLNQVAGDAYGFEEKLTDAFNLFSDVQAEWIGGAGNTDIECLFVKAPKKFAVDAKSTSRKLTYLNSGRLRLHREKISADYTMVITPSFTPSALTDIENSDVVILLVSTLRDYLFNALNFESEGLSFEDLDSIVCQNLGKDVTELVSHLTAERYGIGISGGDFLAT